MATLIGSRERLEAFLERSADLLDNLRGTLEIIKLVRAAHDDHGVTRLSDVSTVAVAGRTARKSSHSPRVKLVPVGLLGLQTNISRVSAVTRSADSRLNTNFLTLPPKARSARSSSKFNRVCSLDSAAL